jgi:diguanylate cyclase (GGDEF)-like protein
MAHPVGGLVLIAAAKALKESVRKIDYVGRYGGEEFLVILPGTDSKGAYNLAERCRQQLETIALDIGKSERIKITGSIGLFCSDKDRSIPAEQMLHNADEARYKTKASGRNCVIISENEKDLLPT